MRRALLITAVAVLSACPPAIPPNPPPVQQFYFPSGVAFVPSATPDGVLYVANGNFDRLFDTGSVTAIDLSKVGTPTQRLPLFGAPVPESGPVQIPELNLPVGEDGKSSPSVVQIASFAGEIGVLKIAGGVRLFIPTRSENSRVYAIDAPTPVAGEPPTVHCFMPNTPDAGTAKGQDCTPTGQSLTALEKTETGVPRSPSPIGVAVTAAREVWFTSLQQADSPRGSLLDSRAYLVHVNGDDPQVSESSFVNIGTGATSSIAAGARYVYATGRIFEASTPSNLVRLVDTGLNPFQEGRSFNVLSPGLEGSFRVFEGRGIAVSSDESRLYIAGRAPDSLLVASVSGKEGSSPAVQVQRGVPLPAGPDGVLVLPRAGRGDLVAITCASAGVVAFYDDDVGDLVAQVAGVGLQPFGLAADLKPSGGARLYATNFTDGRVAVIDVPDLVHPKSVRIVAYLGQPQLCLTRGSRGGACDGGMQ
jgi:DNA-binding beta-propeller fold protein YncE